MTVNSWMHLHDEDPRHVLPETLRAQDPMAARDCGWVEQMTPFIRSHASKDAWMIDPFCGFGSTLVAASIEGVRAVGVERDVARGELARRRLSMLGANPDAYPVITGNVADAVTRETVNANGGHEPRRFTLCLTNVPYFGCPPLPDREQGQLYGEQYYEPYLQGLRAVFAGIHTLLEPGGWCIAMAQNLRLGDTFVPLAWDVARLLGERFVLHDERVLVYDKADAAATTGPSPTNRAHEYVLICRKQPARLDKRKGRLLLDELAQQEGFEFMLYGSFARSLVDHEPEDNEQPNDIDLLCPPDDADISRLMIALEARGFRIESWNAPVTPPVALTTLAYRYYFRARRVANDGAALQLDIAIAESRAAFNAQVALANRQLAAAYPVLVR